MNNIYLSILIYASMATNLFADAEATNVSLQEKTNFYAGGAINYARAYEKSDGIFSRTDNDTQDVTAGLTAIIGYKNLFDDQIKNKDFSFDIEGRFSKSLIQEDFSKTSSYSIFLKPKYSFEKDFNAYLLLGMGQVIIDGKSEGTLLDETSFQWGLGLNYQLANNLTTFIDYTSLIQDSDAKVYNKLSNDAINIGLTYHFNIQ